METWLASNWYWLLPIVAGPALLAYKVHRRGGDESLPRRVLFTMFPILDSNSELRRKMTPLQVALLAIGMLVFLVAFVIFDALNP